MEHTEYNQIFPAIDSHVDLLYDLMRRHEGVRFDELDNSWITRSRLNTGGVRVMVSAYYCPDSHNGPKTAATFLRHLLDYGERFLESLPLISDGKGLEASYSGSSLPGVIPLLENADALVEFGVERLRDMGFRMVGLTHVGSNRLADGNRVDRPAGLTAMGRDMVRRLDRPGMVIDMAHLSEPAFFQVCDCFGGPLVSTHTGMRAFHNDPRNLSNEQARLILERDGMIGVAAAPEILSPYKEADIRSVFNHVDHLVQRYEASGVGLGSDFGGYDATCVGLEDHSRLPALAEMLLGAGYPPDAVAGIMGENWFRFFKRLLLLPDT